MILHPLCNSFIHRYYAHGIGVPKHDLYDHDWFLNIARHIFDCIIYHILVLMLLHSVTQYCRISSNIIIFSATFIILRSCVGLILLKGHNRKNNI